LGAEHAVTAYGTRRARTVATCVSTNHFHELTFH
jgi:hypothetical protein